MVVGAARFVISGLSERLGGTGLQHAGAIVALGLAGVALCSALADPPAPKLPTLPEPVGRVLTVRPLRLSGVVASGLPVRVGCDTACTLTATATLTPRARAAKGRPAVTVALPPARLRIGAGESTILRLRLSNVGARRLRRALRGRADSWRACS
jgi:hypothetical protein